MTGTQGETIDPLRHLSDYEKKLLLAMVPTSDERKRMREKGLTSRSRESLIIEFLLERRSLYEEALRQRCAKVGIEPPAARDVMEPDRLRRYMPLMNDAVAHASEFRIREPERDRDLHKYIREAVNLPDTEPNRRKKRSLI